MKGKKLPPLPPLPGGVHTAKSNKYTNETKFMLKSPPSSSGLAEGGPSAQPTSNTYQSLTNYNSYYKYEKFSSASASDNFVLKVSTSDRNLVLILGTIQMTCGLLMVVFAVLAILHDAALSNFAAGIWSGAMSLGCGFIGVVSGIRSCYYTRHQMSVLCLTIYLALGLINIAVDNLALVIASTGLLRDAQRPTYFVPLQEDDLGLVDAHVEITNWAPVLSNLGLVITLTVQCLVTITSVLKCYRHVCLCSKTSSLHSAPASSSKDRFNLPHPDSPANSFCSSNNSKQKLVRHWLGHQTIGSSRTVSTVATAPSPVFICAPAPFYTMDGRPLYPIPPPPPNGSSHVNYMPHPHSQPHTQPHSQPLHGASRPVKVHKRSQSTRDPYYERRLLDNERKLREEIRRRKSCAKYAQECKSRPNTRPSGRDDPRPNGRADPRPSGRPKASTARCKEYVVSEEDIEKTYTGLDREIAEEFICAVMEPNIHHQQLSDDDQSSYR